MQEASASSFSELTHAFADRIAELKRYTYLRVEESAKEMFTQDLTGIEAGVEALEQHVVELKRMLEQERAAIPKVEALVQAGKVQSGHLQAIANNLPARLPSQPQQATSGPGVTGTDVAPIRRSISNPGASTLGAQGAQKAADDASKRRKEAPRWYVTEKELAALSSYMRGRLTIDKINAALDELAQHADSNAKLVQLAKGAGAAKLAPAERKRATELLHSIAARDGIKGSFWFLEGDLKDGALVKLDKTGKSMMTMFRHLGRFQEVRASIDGVTNIVYVCVEPNA